MPVPKIVWNFLLRSCDWLNTPMKNAIPGTVARIMAITDQYWRRLRRRVMGSPQEKVRKEAEDLLAQLQEAREKPQFVLLDKEGRRLLQAFTALLDKLEGWDPYDQKMADTFDAIMRHMSVLIGQSK